ncbi:hypothetical protein IWX62_002468 [Arthrobacter sp. CAN_A1]
MVAGYLGHDTSAEGRPSLSTRAMAGGTGTLGLPLRLSGSPLKMGFGKRSSRSHVPSPPLPHEVVRKPNQGSTGEESNPPQENRKPTTDKGTPCAQSAPVCAQSESETASDKGKRVPEVGLEPAFTPCEHGPPPKTGPNRPKPAPIRPSPTPKVCTMCTPSFLPAPGPHMMAACAPSRASNSKPRDGPARGVIGAFESPHE